MSKTKLKKFPPHMPISQQNFLAQSEQDLAYDIVDELFDHHESDSLAASQRTAPSATSFVDQRLLYWKMMLRQRRAMQKKLRLATGKQPEQLLFNYPTCNEHRCKETLKRLLDKAQNVDPNNRRKSTEIVGVPRRVAMELLGTESIKNAVENKWLKSELLADQVEAQFGNIEKVLEFYPETNDLEVVGKGIPVKTTGKLESLHSITSSSLKPSPVYYYITPDNSFTTPSPHSDTTSLANRSYRSKLVEDNYDIALLINGMPYKPHTPEFSPNLERMFVCNPFENILRIVMRIENIGREAIRFSWMQADFFAYNDTLFEMLDDEFIFDTSPFLLRFGETREVSVLFRPRKVSIVKQRWLLMTRPRIFFRRPCALTLNMHGRCTAHSEYTNLLMERTLKYMKTLRQPTLKMTFEKLLLDTVFSDSLYQYCPYTRPLEEREAFNQRNRGFNCETFHDMEVLKKFYERIKPYKKYPEWDYSVRWLLTLVTEHEDKRERLQLFQELEELLGRLRGRTKSLIYGDTEAHIVERERTKFLYVRGLIANCIEVWEEKISLLEKVFLKQKLQSQRVNKRVGNSRGSSKHFRESIYIYSYNVLCNLAEDIVSVIGSTELV